jgi:hypothetical protein
MENRMVSTPDSERELVEEFLRQYPPTDPLWKDGSWLKVFLEGADSSNAEIQGAYRRLLLHASIAVRAVGGPVRDNHIAEAVEALSRDG